MSRLPRNIKTVGASDDEWDFVGRGTHHYQPTEYESSNESISPRDSDATQRPPHKSRRSREQLLGDYRARSRSPSYGPMMNLGSSSPRSPARDTYQPRSGDLKTLTHDRLQPTATQTTDQPCRSPEREETTSKWTLTEPRKPAKPPKPVAPALLTEAAPLRLPSSLSTSATPHRTPKPPSTPNVSRLPDQDSEDGPPTPHQLSVKRNYDKTLDEIDRLSQIHELLPESAGHSENTLRTKSKVVRGLRQLNTQLEREAGSLKAEMYAIGYLGGWSRTGE